jgi:hypothetical protein
MSTIANDFRELADDIRSIPGEFGLREYRSFLVRKPWTGTHPGDGDEMPEIIPLTVGNGANPKVRFPSQKEVALGMMASGTMMFGPLTPAYGTGGTDRASLDGSQLEPGVGQIIRVYEPDAVVPGGDSTDYEVVRRNVDHALRITLQCSPVTKTGE